MTKPSEVVWGRGWHHSRMATTQYWPRRGGGKVRAHVYTTGGFEGRWHYYIAKGNGHVIDGCCIHMTRMCAGRDRWQDIVETANSHLSREVQPGLDRSEYPQPHRWFNAGLADSQ